MFISFFFSISDGRSCLHLAVQNKDLETVQALLGGGINVNAATHADKMTALHYADIREIFDYLVRKGSADRTLRNAHGKSSLLAPPSPAGGGGRQYRLIKQGESSHCGVFVAEPGTEPYFTHLRGYLEARPDVLGVQQPGDSFIFLDAKNREIEPDHEDLYTLPKLQDFVLISVSICSV